MRKFLFLCAFLASFGALGQEFCATDQLAPEHYGKFWKKRVEHLKQLNKESGDSTRLWIPIKFHVTGSDSGTGFFPLDLTYNLLCELNEHFDSLNMQFYLVDSVNFIANSAYNDFNSYTVGNQMMNQYNMPDVCNVYIVLNPNGVCGYAYYPGSGPSNGLGGIALNRSCSGINSTTLAHEMGHWLSLPHPFDTRNGIEFVNGTNCATTGDLFCDTRADVLNYRWSCPFLGVRLDPNGDQYNPDQTLFMSYSLDACQSRFSTEQKAAMRYSALNDRPYLFNFTRPPFLDLDTITYNSPADSALALPLNTITLTWNKVPGAQYYSIRATRFQFNGGTWPINASTTDTFYRIPATKLQANFWYRWQVKPVSNANVCENYSTIRHFNTAIGTAVNLINISDWEAYPNPIKNGNALNVTLPEYLDLKNAQIQIVDMQGKLMAVQNIISHKFAMQINSFAAGMYIVKLTGDNYYSIKKVAIH